MENNDNTEENMKNSAQKIPQPNTKPAFKAGVISVGADGTKRLDIKKMLETPEGRTRLAKLTAEINTPNNPD